MTSNSETTQTADGATQPAPKTQEIPPDERCFLDRVVDVVELVIKWWQVSIVVAIVTLFLLQCLMYSLNQFVARQL